MMSNVLTESGEALNLLAEWLTRIQLEGDSQDAERALLRLNCDSVADLARRLEHPASIPSLQTDNLMWALRRFARDHQGGAIVVLNEQDSKKLVDGIASALSVLDKLYEGGTGKVLTDEEKGLA